MTFTEIVKSFIPQTKNGSEVDLLIQVFAGNNLGNPFSHIELDDINELIHMLKGCDAHFIYYVPQANEGLFTVLYKATELSPLARCYFIRKKAEEIESFRNRLAGQIIFGFISDPAFANLIEHSTLQQRLEKHLKRREEKTGDTRKLFDGRKQNTATSAAIVLQTDNCLVCSATATHNLSTTLVSNKGLMINFKVCHNCYKDAAKFDGTNLDFLLKVFNTPSLFPNSQAVSDSELIEMSRSIIEDKLECRIEKIDGMVITAFRNSGFKIIFRLQGGYVEKISYGYMMFDPDNVQISRFDAAPHHNDKLEVAPDHLHYNLKESNGSVRSSYLTGYLSVDFVGIKKLIEKLEEDYKGGCVENAQNMDICND